MYVKLLNVKILRLDSGCPENTLLLFSAKLGLIKSRYWHYNTSLLWLNWGIVE